MITVIGSINLDLIATVERLPKPGETVPGSSFSTAAGGKGANQALAAARAGARVRMIGALGAAAGAPPAPARRGPGGGAPPRGAPTGAARAPTRRAPGRGPAPGGAGAAPPAPTPSPPRPWRSSARAGSTSPASPARASRPAPR